MKIGIVKEQKNNENRVGITPSGVVHLCKAGHQLFVEEGAGLGSGFTDAQYKEAGATISSTDATWACDMVIKVKEPLSSEYHYLREGLILYTYFHLAANKELAEKLVETKVTAVAYETMQDVDGSLPLLAPMSEVAGRMGVIAGMQFLQKQYGGKGLILSGVPGVAKGKVVIIGGGVVGINAAKMALGLGAHVTLLDVNKKVLEKIDDLFGGQVETLFSNEKNIDEVVSAADLVVGAVLLPGAKAPTIVTEETIKKMAPGSVLVDIPIDQGGIFATSTRATTLEDPVYTTHGVINYTVANIPGAVPKTSTEALTSVTIPYATEILPFLEGKEVRHEGMIRSGLNTIDGKVVNQAVAESLDLPYHEWK
ncbi:alanine dehydrogenase [Enterococcus sp. AZ194]|uniref:alanine dehydrogenase n=1 Tax=Enterococcus sp. AZ194 TaxID=2774629 RepID=UPI003F1EB847